MGGWLRDVSLVLVARRVQEAGFMQPLVEKSALPSYSWTDMGFGLDVGPPSAPFSTISFRQRKEGIIGRTGGEGGEAISDKGGSVCLSVCPSV